MVAGAGDGSETHDPTPDGVASESHSALEDLLAIIAHEMRAPLSVVCVAADTATTRELEPGQLEELLQVIRRNAELAMLLTDRLGLAREVELGTFELHRTDLDLAMLAAQTVTDLTPAIAEHRHVTVTAPEPVMVLADETSLREILFNLLLNATKYSPRGSEIDVAVTSDDGDAVLTVRDHGCGVDASEQEHIFGKYQQVDQTAPGVGLGLFISRGLARANGGDLTVGSPTDGGSTFELRLPATSAT